VQNQEPMCESGVRQTQKVTQEVDPGSRQAGGRQAVCGRHGGAVRWQKRQVRQRVAHAEPNR